VNISGLFAGNKIPVFTVWTYDTDYILAKNQYIDVARNKE
jgi:hypothetical protein